MKAANFRQSLKFACTGLLVACRTERNLQRHLVAALLVFGLSIYLSLTATELLFVVLAVFLVIITETVNTAIETTVDLVTGDHHPLAEKAKDVAAGAVLLSALNAVIVGLIILGPKLWRLIA